MGGPRAVIVGQFRGLFVPVAFGVSLPQRSYPDENHGPAPGTIRLRQAAHLLEARPPSRRPRTTGALSTATRRASTTRSSLDVEDENPARLAPASSCGGDHPSRRAGERRRTGFGGSRIGSQVFWHDCMQSTSVRIDGATHQEIKKLASTLGATVGATVALAVRGLRQELIGRDLRGALTADETKWLDADLG